MTANYSKGTMQLIMHHTTLSSCTVLSLPGLSLQILHRLYRVGVGVVAGVAVRVSGLY